MTAQDWQNVDDCVKELAASAKTISDIPTVWMYDVQNWLNNHGTTAARAFHEACAMLNRLGVKTLSDS